MKARDLDENLCSPARIAIMAELLPGEEMSFSRLKKATGLADGNLHVQAGRLAGAGYLTARKMPRGRRTLTTFRVTELGQVRFLLYVKELEAALQKGEGVIRPMLARGRHDDAQVWS